MTSQMIENITARTPRFWYEKHEKDTRGSRDITVNGRAGLIRVIVYVGGEHGSPFTSFSMYLGQKYYGLKLPRVYHDRWLLRLALRFEYEVQNLVDLAVSK